MVWATARSFATTCAITFVFFSSGYLDVSVPRVRFSTSGIMQLHCIGLFHSEICGSMVICTYPQLIAAYHVLHRFLESRHPPFVLVCFFIFFARVKLHKILRINTAIPSLVSLIVMLFYCFFSFCSICQRSLRYLSKEE